MDKSFRVAPYSALAWVWTITFVLGLIFLIYSVVISAAADYLEFALAVAAAVVIVYGYMRSVRSYRVTDSDVQIIRSGTGRITIDRADITSIEARPNIGNFFNLSVLSIGGLFGWAGKARVRQSSDLTSLEAEVFGTNSASSVLMQLKSGRKLILTPADPSGFVAAVRK